LDRFGKNGQKLQKHESSSMSHEFPKNGISGRFCIEKNGISDIFMHKIYGISDKFWCKKSGISDKFILIFQK
jgi:hypothetical protein